MMLVQPHSGARVRCTANKRWALTVDVPGAPGTMTTLFRTNAAEGLTARARREARARGQRVYVFRMGARGEFYGSVDPDGSIMGYRESA